MTDKHTPGPWYAIHNRQFRWVESATHTVCVFYQWNSDGSMSESADAEANARLIAAAPCLLASLEDLVTACENADVVEGHASVGRARSAISKAKGETT